MKIAITGGLGFLGSHITTSFLETEHKITVFARKDGVLPDGVSLCRGDLMIPGKWQKELAGHDVVINLAGTNIFQRWNEEKKDLILQSRIQSTRNIVDAILSKGSKVKLFINASATGYYGLRGEEDLNESSVTGDDFLAEVCSRWEDEALRAKEGKRRVVILRLASVFGKDGGAFPTLKRVFSAFMGARLGHGRQWFPWIHVDDVTGIIHKIVDDKKMTGPYNCVSPGIVRNADFTREMAFVIGRPVIIPFVPGFLLRVVLGEFGNFLTGGQRALPEKLLKEGYRFKYPDIKSTLCELNDSQKYFIIL